MRSEKDETRSFWWGFQGKQGRLSWHSPFINFALSSPLLLAWNMDAVPIGQVTTLPSKEPKLHAKDGQLKGRRHLFLEHCTCVAHAWTLHMRKGNLLFG